VADSGGAEGRNSENDPNRRESKLAFHRVGLHSALVTLAFPPDHRMTLNIGKLLLHCNIAGAAKSETCRRTPLPASAALD
jgi:hypothetical protein